jgi:excisionase family DNA binding protein
MESVRQGSSDLRDKAFISYGQTARLLNVGLRTVEQAVARGELWGVTLGSKKRIAVRSLADLVARGVELEGHTEKPA